MKRGWLCVLLLGACASPAPRCTDAPAREPLTAPARYLLGDAIGLTRDPTIREREEALNGSMSARRQLGWSVASELLEPVPIEAGGATREVPRFSTWFDPEDLRRVYRHLDRDAPITDEALDAAFAYNRDAVLDFEAWPADRLAAYIDAVDSAERAHGLGGTSRVLYGPRAARHLLRSRDALMACRGTEIDLLDADPDALTPTQERRQIEGCETRRFGPYFVAQGGSLRAEHLGELTLSVIGANAQCDETSCEVAGPARVELEATGRTMETVTLDVAYDDSASLWVPCLDSEMPDGAAIVKADYRRIGFGFELDEHDTSRPALTALRDGTADWADAVVGSVDPGAESIHTVELPNGDRYRLVGLHAMVKELDHWVWVTLFWQPGAGTGFAADSPLAGPLASYGMCAVTGFTERDADASGGAMAGSLGDVLAATHEGEGASSWCSNPYLEEGAGNARTNCVGCHQHAGGGVTSESVLADFDDHGRPLVRTNFPTDYVFSTQDLIDIFLEP